MKVEFIIEYKEKNVSKMVKSIVEEVREKERRSKNISDRIYIETILSDKFIDISTVGFKPSKWSKEDLLNIMRKQMSLSYQEFKKTKGKEATIEEFISTALYYFTHDVYRGGNIEYMIYHSAIEDEKSIFRNGDMPVYSQYTFQTDCINDLEDLPGFLMDTSECLNSLVHRRECKDFLQNIGEDFKMPDIPEDKKLFTIEDIYRKSHPLGTHMLYIDFMLDALYRKRHIFNKMLEDLKDPSKVESVMESLKGVGSENSIGEEDFIFILSLIQNRKEIMEEIEVFEQIINLSKILGEYSWFIEDDVSYVEKWMGRVQSASSYIINRFKNRCTRLTSKYKELKKEAKDIQREVEAREKRSEDVEQELIDRGNLLKHWCNIKKKEIRQNEEFILAVETIEELKKDYAEIDPFQKEYLSKKAKYAYYVSRGTRIDESVHIIKLVVMLTVVLFSVYFFLNWDDSENAQLRYSMGNSPK